jgi:hypothetical protein
MITNRLIASKAFCYLTTTLEQVFRFRFNEAVQVIHKVLAHLYVFLFNMMTKIMPTIDYRYKIHYIRSSERFFKTPSGLAYMYSSAWIKSIKQYLRHSMCTRFVISKLWMNEILEKWNQPVQPCLRSNPYLDSKRWFATLFPYIKLFNHDTLSVPLYLRIISSSNVSG